jgi:hypothetical protein
VLLSLARLLLLAPLTLATPPMDNVMFITLLVMIAMLAQMMLVTQLKVPMVLAPSSQFHLVMTRMLVLMTPVIPRLDVSSLLSMSL